MIPVLTPAEMAGVDRQATTPVDVLVGRAGAAVARRAARLLGGTYGREVVVVAGKGNNGADGRVAAKLLAADGARVTVLEAAALAPGAPLPEADLVVDAAYGTGLERPYSPPDPGRATVLAVDIPSGLSGLTGEVLSGGGAMAAAATVTFASLKPGLLLGAGPTLAGDVDLADIGLGQLVDATATCWVVEDRDVVDMVPRRPHDSHKWLTAVQVVAGSPGMTGAPWFVSRAALRAGSGYVRLSMPGVEPTVLPPSEVVHLPVPAAGWSSQVLEGLSRVKALVVGPGLGPAAASGGDPGLPGGEVGALVANAPVPVVIDADGLNAIGSLDALQVIVSRRSLPTVITPHAGELTRLAGHPPGADHVAAARGAATRSGAIVLLKGSTTVVASPSSGEGAGAGGSVVAGGPGSGAGTRAGAGGRGPDPAAARVLLSTAGDSRLATAGTGDILSGVIGAFIARGVPAFEAAALGAHVHGRAARTGLAEGLVAGDLPDLVATWLSESLHK
ncbi:MAG TPA: NAD(P)H-hydrate dehydratase [Acidimicrobiales bacterium]|nr:NAD(P)H-hydrate dehydratase [Acidimicrobiales bacterium]